MTATITPISRPNRRYCSSCQNGYSGPDGIYCGIFRLFVDNEACATDCEMYEAVPAPKKRPAKSKQIVNADYLQVMNDPLVQAVVTYSPPLPVPWTPTHDQAAAYIRSLHTTLWGQQIIVAKEADLHRAADWVVQLFANLKEHANA